MEREAEHGETGREAKATLYVVATPIGNLGDITLRALEVLRSADVIAAEDTRVTAKLLNHYSIAAKKMISLHEHNEQRAAQALIPELEAGRSIALVSDAGTPAFSDPGARLVTAARTAGFAIAPVAGANAAAAALSVSGFANPHFVFYGFLAPKAAERRKALQTLAPLPYTLVFYEAPHRVLETIADLAQVLGGERTIVIARELTKLFESIYACRLDRAGEWLRTDANRLRGEFVLMLEGARAATDSHTAEAQRTLAILLEELPVKQAAALAARITGARKNDLYTRALELRSREE